MACAKECKVTLVATVGQVSVIPMKAARGYRGSQPPTCNFLMWFSHQFTFQFLHHSYDRGSMARGKLGIQSPITPGYRRWLSPFAPGPWCRWRRWFSIVLIIMHPLHLIQHNCQHRITSDSTIMNAIWFGLVFRWKSLLKIGLYLLFWKRAKNVNVGKRRSDHSRKI